MIDLLEPWMLRAAIILTLLYIVVAWLMWAAMNAGRMNPSSYLVRTEHLCGAHHRCVGPSPVGKRLVCDHRCGLAQMRAG